MKIIYKNFLCSAIEENIQFAQLRDRKTGKFESGAAMIQNPISHVMH